MREDIACFGLTATDREIASFGGAVVVSDFRGRLEIVGGEADERKRAQHWLGQFMTAPRWGSPPSVGRPGREPL